MNEPLKIYPLDYPKEILLEVSELTLKYGEKPVCEHLRFSIARKERVAIIGPNGSGKSSLLQWILNQEIEYEGNVYRGSQLKISYVPQEPSFLKGELNAFIEQRGVDETLMKTILRKMGFERSQFEKMMQDYSFGQKKKVLWQPVFAKKRICIFGMSR
jgi:lincosamide and streptogramin A transport system ATP-binding/permease protein